MIELTLIRTRSSEAGIFGELKADGSHFLYTLEHSYNNAPKIPAGTYTCVRGQHQLHSGPIETFEITGVEGHSGLLFHPGNTEDDSEGCVLLGRNSSNTALFDSRKAFGMFMTALEGKNSFTLVVKAP